MQYSGDFETTVDPLDCRVWAWGLCNIDETDQFEHGTDIESFFNRVSRESCKVYFQNLKFDGEFLLYYLFRNNFDYVPSRNDLYTKSFCTLISDSGQWYSIQVCFERKVKGNIMLTVLDSMKLLPFSVDKVAQTFKLDVSKIEKPDEFYKRPRAKGHQLDPEEKEYLKADCQIMAMALQTMFTQSLTAMTIGSNALKDFKRIFDEKEFKRTFPVPDYDSDIRKAYRGGFTHLMKKYRNKTVKVGIVLDVNSLYPYVMYSKLMPYGNGQYFDGEYEKDDIYPLYIQAVSCLFTLKKNHIPTIQIKKNNLFNQVEYVETSGPELVTLFLTCVDLLLFTEQYEVTYITYISGWKFKATRGLFCDYIDKWSTIKITAKLEGNAGMYTIAKLMLNSLYGKFALNPEVISKEPEYDKTTDMVHYTVTAPETRTPVYIPVGAFITSYAREHTIRAAQALYKRFVYADTDSLHLKGAFDSEITDKLEVDPVILGAWKHELNFSKAHYIRAKTYIEVGHEPESGTPDKLQVTCAGLPEKCHKQVTFNNFRPGMKYKNKLRPKHVPGGIVLENSIFSIKML